MGPATLATSVATGDQLTFLSLNPPQSVFGTPVKLKSVTICYQSVGATIDFTRLEYGDKGQGNDLYVDITPRTSTTPACYTVDVPPTILTGSLFLQLSINYPATSDYIWLDAVKATLGT